MEENVNSFQKSCVFVSNSSQKLRVNLLVGFEDYIFLSITAALKQKQRCEVHSNAHQFKKKSKK